MKLTLGKHGWPVVVTEFDLNTATQDDIDVLGCLINHYTLVVLKNQKLSVPTEEAVCKMFGETLDELIDVEQLKKLQGRLTQPGGNITLRVTGEKDDAGQPGLFGFNHELKWHANKVERASRRSLIWLYGERGTLGSQTHFTNHVLAYNSLPATVKEQIKDLKTVYIDTANYSKDERETLAKFSAVSHTPPVIYTNVGGQTGIFLSWLHLDHFVGLDKEQSSEIAHVLEQHILGNPTHIYEHDWEDGDVLLCEQWLGVHRRPAFEHMDKRVLHRIETDFSKIDFTKMADSLKLVTAKE
jgi:alpha-ketoglutarate-dependent taurine dioxygenase